MAKRRGLVDGEYQDGEARGRIFLAGESNFGKTTELLRLLEQCSGPAAFYDHTGRHRLWGSVLVHQPADLMAEIRRSWGRPWRVTYEPTSGDLVEHFAAFCRVMAAVGGVVVGVDEIDAYCGPRWGDSRLPPALYKLVHHGRHCGSPGGPRGVALVYTARIPASVAEALRTQASEWRLFYDHSKRQIKEYLEPAIGPDAARMVPQLRRFEFLIWRPGCAVQAAGGRR
jgi:hypothetical protein